MHRSSNHRRSVLKSLIFGEANRVYARSIASDQGSEGFASSSSAPIAAGTSDPVAWRETHPLKTGALARLTMSVVSVLSPE